MKNVCLFRVLLHNLNITDVLNWRTKVLNWVSLSIIISIYTFYLIMLYINIKSKSDYYQNQSNQNWFKDWFQMSMILNMLLILNIDLYYCFLFILREYSVSQFRCFASNREHVNHKNQFFLIISYSSKLFEKKKTIEILKFATDFTRILIHGV